MVKVLVATIEGQGARPDDYARAIDGELVYLPAQVCHCPSCGCEQGFIGLASNRATTTALVVDRPDLTVPDLRNALADSLGRHGHSNGPDGTDPGNPSKPGTSKPGDDVDLDAEVKRRLQRLLAAVAHFQVGSILERDGEQLRRRALAEPLQVPFGVLGDDRV